MQEKLLEIWKQVSVQSERIRLIVWLECLQLEMDNGRIGEYLDLLLSTNELLPEEKLKLYWQIHGMLFTYPQITVEVAAKRYAVWRKISEDYQCNFPNPGFIKWRRRDVVLVTVQQFLGMAHSPTKTTLDRAYTMKKMGKTVLIVNTAEMLGGCMPGVGKSIKPNYNDELSQCTELEYLGEKIPFVQFGPDMPNVSGTKVFLDYVSRLKPCYIVNIGGDSLSLDCAAKLVPVLNINAVASEIDATLATRQVIGRSCTAEDELHLSLLGLSKQNVIQGRFTFPLPSQENHYTRENLNLPKGKFVIVIIGNRLTQELDWTFVSMIEAALKKGGFLAIVGEMDTYEEMCSKNVLFKENSYYMGRQPDLLAVLECCDLYVNPQRKGGGTSAIDAMYKSLPVVSIKEGDVAMGAGEDFCVNNYEEMSNTIEQYMCDETFYRKMSEKAKARAAYMMDSDTAFREILTAFENQCLD